MLEKYVAAGSVPGAVALVGRGAEVDLQAVGAHDVEGSAPMTPDSIFRIASITKPIVAAAVLMLVEDGRLALDEPVAGWLPELAAPMVVRTPSSPLDDLVPAERPITVYDLLTSTAGYGFASDFELPAVAAMFPALGDGREVAAMPPPDEWMRRLAGLPLVHQPGRAYLYNTCSDLQGVLIARASGSSLPDFLATRIFEPLGMVDTGFAATDRSRLTSYYRHDGAGLVLVDGPDGQYAEVPAFPSGAGGLVSTAADWLAFARFLLGGGQDLLSAESVRAMTTNHLTPAQAEPGALFLDGQGWGFGGAVDIAARDPWNVPGRYGWVGGTGTAGYVFPDGTVAILLTQVALDSPVPPDLLRDFCTYAAGIRPTGISSGSRQARMATGVQGST
jgi:CubicO group peptidase (beta-lactamase class C family)